MTDDQLYNRDNIISAKHDEERAQPSEEAAEDTHLCTTPPGETRGDPPRHPERSPQAIGCSQTTHDGHRKECETELIDNQVSSKGVVDSNIQPDDYSRDHLPGDQNLIAPSTGSDTPALQTAIHHDGGFKQQWLESDSAPRCKSSFPKGDFKIDTQL